MAKDSKPTDLTKGSSPKTSPELKETELDKVSGGAGDYLLTLDGIKGESQDDKHKDTILISSFKTH
jgi:hypothetical protein